MLTRFISRKSLRANEARSLSPAVADRLAESIVGRARAIWELATGLSPIADGGGTARNPQGRLGLDRSGPPWGDAHTHPLWTYEADAGLSAVVYGAPTPWISLTALGQVERRTVLINVRPFEGRTLAPYSRGILNLRALRIGGAGTATATIRCFAGGDLSASTTGAISATSNTALQTSTSAPWVGLAPGPVPFTFEVESTSTTGMEIWGAALSQTARRSH